MARFSDAWIAALVLVMGCQEDPDRCELPSDLPVSTIVVVGLYDADGEPLCTDAAYVRALQIGTGLETDEFQFSAETRAVLGEDGKSRLVVDTGCNVYTNRPLFGEGQQFVACVGGMEVDVEVPGCIATTVTWTPEDNHYPGSVPWNWSVPVTVICPDGPPPPVE